MRSSPAPHEMSVAEHTRPAVITSREEAVSAAQRFVAGIADGVIERDRTGALPVAELARFDASGLLGLSVPAQDGGSGLPPSVLAEVVRTVAMVDPAIAQAPQGHYLFTDVLAAFGSEEQRRRLFADALAGRRIANALAERGGAHAQDLQTRLLTTGRSRETPGTGARLAGRKHYATGALTAHWIAVTARDDADRLVLAFVERDADGVTLDRDWNVMGQRATVSGGVALEAVAVDPALVLPYAECFQVPQQLGARAQLYHAAIQVGIAGGALRDARDFLVTRARPFFEAARAGWAARAVDDPHTIHGFGRLATQVAAAEALLRDAAGTLDEIGLVPLDAEAAARGSLAVAQAKAFGSETAVAVASDIFSLTGASAADPRYALDRHWRNARTHASHDPADWKYHHIGNHRLSGVLPPNHGQL
jgi:SfnB family sulfur acquisition oxidoreductase